MKTKFYWVALLASAALIAQANAGGFHGGGGGFAGGAHAAPARGGGGGRAASFAPHAYSGGGRMMYVHPGFSSMGGRLPANADFQQRNFNSRAYASRHSSQDRLATPQGDRAFRNTTGQMRSGNNLRPDWRNHVVAQHSANWHRDWDRRRDHFFNGHRCRFVNGSWFVFDFGFDPYDYWYPWPYPYSSYPYGSSAYDYAPYYYQSYNDADYYDEGVIDSSDQNIPSVVVAAQQELARRGYYRGEIDGVSGPATQRAIGRYQRDHRIDVTGQLNSETLQELDLSPVAGN